MSTDYFYVTPNDYTLQTFLSRLPETAVINEISEVHIGYYCIEFNGRHAWIEQWDNITNGYPNPEDAFNEIQKRSIASIPNRLFYTSSGSNEYILDELTVMIGDDSNIFICRDTDDPFLPGNVFVENIRKEREERERIRRLGNARH